jgi:prepilin-type N-terminal cleavage/methylation domain-containing protein
MSSTKSNSALNKDRGFTLIEIAVVLLIITILMTGLVPTISSQIEQKQLNETRKQLDEIQQALIGYAIVNERLPCPATLGSNGAESPADAASGTPCTLPYNGFIPAATLGITQVNSKGLAIDGWNNPIRYAVSTSGGANNDFTKTGGMKAAGISSLSPDLLVCSTSTGTTNTSCGGTTLTPNKVPAVIISTGKNGGQIGGTSPDEAANQDGGTSKTFVSHDNSPTFDDIVVWISPNILINRMIAAGKLP